MSMSFERIPRLVWGCGDKRYGDKNAKEKATELVRKEEYVFIDQGFLRRAGVSPVTKDDIYTFGYQGRAVKAETALKILEDFKLEFFSEFMLRDLYKLPADHNYRINNLETKARLVLDFCGGFGTDHCYD